MNHDVEVLGDTRDRVGESPLWSVAEQALYWVDIEGRQVRRFDWATQALASWTLPERVGCIALDGAAPRRLVAALEGRVVRLVLGAGGAFDLLPLASVEHRAPGMRFNDGRCDRQGRFWAGTMCMDMGLASPAGGLYRFDETRPDDARLVKAGSGNAVLGEPVVDGLVTPNGLAFSPDGRTLYLSDSHPSVQAVWRFDYDIDTGTPSGRRLFIDMKPLPGRPDGAAVDAEGGYWVCANDAGLVHRFLPDGRLDRSLPVPAAKPAMCAFGGPSLDLLFVTSITPGAPLDGHDPTLAGAVFMLRPGVTGLAETAFGGR